jgi:cation:H+ antiporter
MVHVLILLILGFILLKKGADMLVEGSSSLAKRFKISDAVIGLTVVALGTTMPELTVGLTASFSGQGDVVLGNAIGSTIANSLFVLGVAALVSQLVVRKETASQELPFFFFSVLAVLFLANDAFLDGSAKSIITRADGLVLLVLFIAFLYYTFTSGRFAKQDIEDVKVEQVKFFRPHIAVGMVVGGAAALFLGGRWVVDGAVEMAAMFHISEALIGLTLVAFGTSLPELFTAITAARKNKADIAVGNIVGANILNLVWIIGFCSFVKGIDYSTALNTDLLFSAGAAVLLSVMIYVGKKNILSKLEGGVLLGAYLAYLAFIVIRG